MFRDRVSAERAVADLQQFGYTQNDISVMMNDQTRARDFAADTGSKAAEGAGVGAGIGGTLGAIIAAVTATGSVAAIAATGAERIAVTHGYVSQLVRYLREQGMDAMPLATRYTDETDDEETGG